MTVITLSTVGFGELRPLSAPGKVFSTLLILLGVGTLAYAATKTTEALMDRRLFRRRRMQMEIKRLCDHVIVCGRSTASSVASPQTKGSPLSGSRSSSASSRSTMTTGTRRDCSWPQTVSPILP